MSETILLVFEGARTEPNIFDNIQKVFFNKSGKSMVYAIFGTEIYKLWKEIKEDPDLDTLALLKETAINKAELTRFSRKEIAEIHLFFDYEGHAHPEMTIDTYNSLIAQMLATFNQENDPGRLWISYPMVEAIKHCKKNITTCFNRCLAETADNTKYKKRIGRIPDFQNARVLKWPDWRYLLAINIQKAFCLVEGYYKMPSYIEAQKLFDQMIIFENQKRKFIIPAASVVVLSSFPFFLSDYFGERQYRKILKQKYVKPCRFCCIS
ncbi:hypothetical protein FACS189450_09910 [Spirochaetia bacterium]|nr:hypothetical protein FACS189450_09910 [Spirochaetia bacterium]GHU94677.1 hypothetical protein FACS189479_07680 [Spirochaetia bacterium]